MNTGDRVVIFGNGQFAELAWYVLTHDSPWQVAAFTVDGEFLRADRLQGLPVVPFESLAREFPPGEFRMLVALGYRQVNRLRADRYRQCQALGYRFVSWVSSRAVTWPDLRVGENCMVFEQTVIQPFATVGDNVIIRGNTYIAHHTRVGDHCFVSSGVTTGGAADIGDYAFAGLNATILNGVRIAPRCIIAAGAVVTRDTQENGVYMGVPARRHEVPADAFPLE